MQKRHLEQVISLRRELHQHPEPSGEERWTKKRLLAFISEHTKLEICDRGRWFYAVYRTGNSGKNTQKIAFRADFDALRMEENLELPHKSRHIGIAHKCGHDGHSAILAGLALEIDRQGAEADIFFLFQFGEENGSGAKECTVFIDENKIDAIYALHNMSDMECKAIYVRDGITHYTSTGMIIELTGSPCHASEPEKGRNPARALAQIVLELEKIAGQKNDSGGEVLCTVIQIALGEEAFGISASKGRLLLTLRAEYEQELIILQNAIERYAKEKAEEQQLQYSVSYMDYFPETRNHHESSNAVRQLRRHGFTVRELERPFRTSEDFGYYLKKTKGAIFYLGNGYQYPAIHTAEYDFNDQIIETGVEAFKALIKQQQQIFKQKQKDIMSNITTEKEKNKQIKKEVRASLLLYLAFFLWWYCTGYGIAEAGTPATYHYVFGLPMWFFLSTVVGYFLFCIASFIVVKMVFTNFELGEEEEEKCHTR